MSNKISEERPLKTVERSRSEVTHVVMQTDINGQGRLFGGRLMAWIDEAGGMTAMRHSTHEVITASVDNLVFKAEAKLNDMVVLIGKVTYVGNSSMEVRVDSYREDNEGMRIPINRAYLTYVATDPNGRPIPVPYGLAVEGPAEEAELQGALKRKALRLKRKEEAF
ncbi:MAG: acyl-CoA thioesterase [Lachnospiraceae bacterium]|nr:acyl-CoA thioesterase [Lachnospiraceae bacterium]